MSARFRVRTPQGQELSFASHEMFAEFVRSGDLSPDDVVYDAETKEWSSARTHPVVLQIELEDEDAAAAEEAGGGEDVGGGDVASTPAKTDASKPASSTEARDLGLELAPEPERPSGEEAAKAFVAKMEAERAAEQDFDDRPAENFKVKHGGIVEEISKPAPPSTPPSTPPSAPPTAPPPPRPRPQPAARTESTPAPHTERPKKPKKKRSAAARHAPFLIVGAVVLAVGAYFGSDLLTATAGGTSEGVDPGPGTGAVTPAPEPPEPPPLIPPTEEALRERAQERFLNRTRLLLRDLQPIPEVWLTGPYLAAPSDYPEVRAVWEDYLLTIREVRVGDEQRYLEGYETALDDARLAGEAREVRLATATADFLQTLGARVAHYDRVEAMATAAIQGHDALLNAEGTIAYEPGIGGRGGSGDPRVEAVGRGPEAQALLDEVTELLFGRLEGEGGPGEVANVREWVYDGLLDAVTS